MSDSRSASYASNAASRAVVRVIPEYDTKVRQANIALFTCPVDGVPSSMNAAAYQHWALVFHFVDDDSYRKLEGYADEYKKLYPSYTKERPREEGRFLEVGSVTTSPAQLREYAYNNPSNGKPYGLTLENCQDWVLNVARKFGPTFEEKVKNFHTLKEVNYWGAYVVDKKVLCNRSFC